MFRLIVFLPVKRFKKKKKKVKLIYPAKKRTGHIYKFHTHLKKKKEKVKKEKMKRNHRLKHEI